MTNFSRIGFIFLGNATREYGFYLEGGMAQFAVLLGWAGWAM